MKRDKLLEQVKKAIRELEPDAEIILYGSRSREDAVPDSDWDFPILLNGPVDHKRAMVIRHRLYELEWDYGEVLSSIIRSRDDWNSPRHRATPFHTHVEKEGVPL